MYAKLVLDATFLLALEYADDFVLFSLDELDLQERTDPLAVQSDRMEVKTNHQIQKSVFKKTSAPTLDLPVLTCNNIPLGVQEIFI